RAPAPKLKAVFAPSRLRVRSGKVSSFFFQAEDGIRDYKVTGVQTCALPIFAPVARAREDHPEIPTALERVEGRLERDVVVCNLRSEERRVGKECRSRGSQ